MSRTSALGRLGNQIIRNLACHFIAKKFDLNTTYSSKELIEQLGIDLFSGNCIYTSHKNVNDNNYFQIYNSSSLESNIITNSYFQTREITHFIYNYLHTDEIKSKIIEKNPYKERYNKNNDLYIHIRLTDAKPNNPSIHYYLNTIKKVNFDNMYI